MSRASWRSNWQTMKKLLIVTALIEAGAGVSLMCWPSATVAILLGSSLDTTAALALGRVAGAALLALGVACWLAYYDAQSCAARGLVSAMVLYNLGAVIILGTAGFRLQPVGVALWPAVVLHTAMAVWCITCLLIKPAQIGEKRNES
jgi:hypothetical protein